MMSYIRKNKLHILSQYKNYRDISTFKCTFIYVKMGGFQTCVIVYANPAADIEA